MRFNRRSRFLCSAAVAFLLVLLAGIASAATIDFTDGTIFSGALNQPSFSTNAYGYTISLAAQPTGARLWWDATDGFGVQYSYEGDEIESVERLKIFFSAPVYIATVLITDLFNEGYLECGAYRLNGGDWISFHADPGQTLDNSNGELRLLLDPSILINSIVFKAPGELTYQNQNHEFSVAAIETTAVPLPAAAWLLGCGLAGLVGLRRRNS
jgi:hypothetical protein